MASNAGNFLAREQNRSPRGWAEPLLRGLILAGLLYSFFAVARQGVAVWHYRRGSPAGLARAVRWDPGDAQFYVALARALEASPEEGDVNDVVRLCERATRLSPNRARYWAELGSSYEWAGREQDARRAYERARQLFPESPEMNWKLGNFYLRGGRIEEALHAFRQVLEGDPALRRSAFDLASRASDTDAQILDEMIPADADVAFAYLGYLMETKRMDAAQRVWRRILDWRLPFEPHAAFPYLEALIGAGRVDELVQAWRALAERFPAEIRARRLDSNCITNGDFEDDILNGGLDWRIGAPDGSAVDVDTLVHFDGARAIRLRFDGAQNVDFFGGLFQFVPAQPNTEYRFLGYLRTQNLTTDSGVRFLIHDGVNPAKLSVSTENLLGSTDWTPYELRFRTGPETRLLVVRVVRFPSHKFDNRIAGTAWVDRVGLYPLGALRPRDVEHERFQPAKGRGRPTEPSAPSALPRPSSTANTKPLAGR